MKRALVLAGGGSRGSYQLGVWRALRELDWNFDIVTGTSVGALNGALATQGDFDVALQLWNSISTADVLDINLSDKPESLRQQSEALGHFLGEMARNGGADPRPLEAMLRRYIDEPRIRASAVDFAFVTVEYPTFAPRIISKSTLPDGELVDYLMASAACFPAMKMRQIGAAKYIDGGYYDNMPVQLAIERGADEIVAVDLEAIGRKRNIKQPGVHVHSIRSRWSLGIFLLFDRTVAQRNMQLGYLDVMKAFGRLEGEAYTFNRGEILHLGKPLEGAFHLLAMKTGLAVQKYHLTSFDAGANTRLARLVRFRTGARAPTVSAIGAAAETTARIFGLSPLDVYTAESFCSALGKLTAVAHSDAAAETARALTSAKNAREFLEVAGNINRASVVAFFRAELRQCTKVGEVRLLPLMATFAPDELIAAMYLHAVEAVGTA